MTTTRADQMFLFFKQIANGTYPVKPEQVPLMKMYWRELHTFTGKELTFSADYSHVRVTDGVELRQRLNKEGGVTLHRRLAE